MSKNSPHRHAHNKRKAIRDAQKEPYETPPSTCSDKTKKTYLSSKDSIRRTQAKLLSKRKHHLTTPKEVGFLTEPESIHQEGQHWTQTIQTQTLSRTQSLQHKLQKKRESLKQFFTLKRKK